MDSDVAAKVKQFFSKYPARSYKKGQILIHAGDEPEHIFYLTSGKVKQYDVSYRGDEVILNVFKPPAFFPMSHAVNKLSNDYFFEAEADVELHLAPINDVVTFIRAEPEVLFDLLSRVYRGTDGLIRRMAHMMAGTARNRIIYELIIECRRFGGGAGSEYNVALTEAEIGSRAGLSRETVSREIHKLKAEGLLNISNQHIVVNKLSQLEETLGKDL